MKLGKKIIEVEGVSKKFLLKKSGAAVKAKEDFIVALNNISFAMNTGESLGIIGKNGSGKSTLLKILAGIIKPQSGIVKIYGSAAAILDLGFGMAPEFTGRENIFLVGGLSGYSKIEMGRLEGEIIDFACIGEFIDQPVKNYSNGMYLRLAFAIKTRLATDLLILDEVIGVGDADFRVKSTETLKRYIKNGGAIILASHSPQEILEFCSRLIWLDNGSIKAMGPASEIMQRYLLESYESNELNARANVQLPEDIDAPVLFKQVTVKAKGKKPGDDIYLEDAVEIDINYVKQNADSKSEVALHLFSITGVHILVDCLTFRQQPFAFSMPDGEYTATAVIPGYFLNLGAYSIDLTFVQDKIEPYDMPRVALFKVELNTALLNKDDDKWAQNISMNDAVIKPHLDWMLKNEKGEVVFEY